MRSNAGQSNADPERQRRRIVSHHDVTEVGCWRWRGATYVNGYGYMRTGPKQRDYVHRISYRLHKGVIPDGYEIDHLCRNRLCVNPEHLEAVPTRINFRRGQHPNAVAFRSGYCRRGLHEMTGHNVMPSADGQRRCRACNYEWQNARRRERRARRGFDHATA